MRRVDALTQSRCLNLEVEPRRNGIVVTYAEFIAGGAFIDNAILTSCGARGHRLTARRQDAQDIAVMVNSHGVTTASTLVLRQNNGRI